MRLLYDNDVAAQHAPSLYAEQNAVATQALRAPLTRHVDTEVAIIGAGFTGLSSAVHLAEAGTEVVLLDAHRVGWGASGRNGGQLGSGYNVDLDGLVERLGAARMRHAWQVAQDSKACAHALAERHDIDMHYRAGIVLAAHRARYVPGLHRAADAQRRLVGYTEIESLDRAGLQRHVASDDYHGGTLDHGAGHIDPLALALGLGDACDRLGVQVHERSPVLRLESAASGYRLVTPEGTVRAAKVIVATNGYHDDLLPDLSRHIMPVNSFVVATEPLGELAEQLLPTDVALADTRFVVGYGRRSRDGRLVFGGAEGYTYRFDAGFPDRVARAVRRVFPPLSGVRMTHAWGGTLAITPSRLPYVRERTQGLIVAGGWSGHGVALSLGTGQAIARAHAGETQAFDTLCALPAGRFPGGPGLRPWLLAGAMTGAAVLDRV